MRKLAISVALGAALLVGCQSSGGDAASSQGGQAPLEEYDEAQAMGGGGVRAGAAPSALGSVTVLQAPAVGPTVIKTADLEVEVERDGFGDAMSEVTSIAAQHGGFVVASTRAGDESRRGSVTVRIPSESFETALGEIRALGDVESENVAGRDVGQEFVDLEARLRNLHAQEAVLLRLFDEAESVADTIRIQNELSTVQLEVERIEGRLRFLRDQTELGTISVRLSEAGVSAPGRFTGAFDRAWNGVLGVLSGLVVFLGYALPLLAIALPVWLVGRRAVRAFGEGRA